MKRIGFILTTVVLLSACGNNASEPAAETSAEPAATQEETTTMEEEAPAAEAESNEVSIELSTTGETMATMAFEPNRLEVPAGAKVKLTLKNVASAAGMIHNAVFIQKGTQADVIARGMEAGADNGFVASDDPDVIAHTEIANPGETKELSFTAPEEPGTYQFICTYPGHTSMKGILIVR